MAVTALPGVTPHRTVETGPVRTGRVTVAGVCASIALVVACGRAPLPIGAAVPASFAGLLHPSPGNGTVAPAVAVISLAVLVACWWRVLRLAEQNRMSIRAVALTGGAWLLPILVAPPLVSMDAYSYLAQGTMVTHGIDPYGGGPVLLGDDPALARVDPRWRATPAPYGPLALLVLRAVVGVHGDVTTQVMLLRLVAVFGVAAAIGAALAMTPAARRAHVLAMCALNPLTLVHLIGGAHLDAIVAGVVGLSLLALRRGTPWLSWLLALTAVAIKVTAAPLLVFVFLVLRRRESGRPLLFRCVASLAALPLLAALAGIHRPWGFVTALAVPGASSPWYAPATVVGQALVLASRALALPVDPGTARTAGRVLVLAAGALLALRLVAAERSDPGGGWPATVRRISLALLVPAVCLPAVYGWYVGAGLFGLAAVADRRWSRVVVALCSCFAFTSLPPLWAANRWLFAGACGVGLAVLVVANRAASPDPAGRAAGRPPVWTGARAAAQAGGRLAGQAAAGARPASGESGIARSFGRIAQVAGLGLVIPAVIGVLSPGANASVLLDREQVDRTAVVQQLLLAYPTLQVGTVLPAVEPYAAYRVELVRPGDTTCVLMVGRRPDGTETFPVLPRQVPPRPSARTTGQGGDGCPPPLPNLLAAAN